MYLPPHFEETRVEELHRYIVDHPLGALIINGPQGLDANHLPFELDAGAGTHGRLFAHVARANPLWQDAKNGDEVLVIFSATNAYISPNWYPSKHEEHRLVPTWNYQAVHAHGRITIRDDEKFVRGVVAPVTSACRPVRSKGFLPSRSNLTRHSGRRSFVIAYPSATGTRPAGRTPAAIAPPSMSTVSPDM